MQEVGGGCDMVYLVRGKHAISKDSENLQNNAS